MMNVTHASTRFYRVEECEFNALNQALCSLNLLKTLATTSDAQQMDCIELGNLLGLIVGCFEKGFFPVADRGATDSQAKPKKHDLDSLKKALAAYQDAEESSHD